MPDYGGWTGKTLRVNLSSGKVSTEDTIEKYKDYLGGTGIGYRVLWDEVPAGTGCFDEANKIVLGNGPLTGTSAPCAGRTSVTTIFPAVYSHRACRYRTYGRAHRVWNSNMPDGTMSSSEGKSE